MLVSERVADDDGHELCFARDSREDLEFLRRSVSMCVMNAGACPEKKLLPWARSAEPSVAEVDDSGWDRRVTQERGTELPLGAVGIGAERFRDDRRGLLHRARPGSVG